MVKKLVGVTPEVIWKLRGTAKMLGGKAIRIPQDNEVMEVKDDCESILPGIGRVNFEFAKEVLEALEYAETVKHHQSGQLLINDMKLGKRIVFNSYI